MAETIYINSLNGKKSKFGIKLSGKSEDLIAEIQKYSKRGYINLELKERKEPGKFGQTHYVVLDTWEPKPKEEGDSLPF